MRAIFQAAPARTNPGLVVLSVLFNVGSVGRYFRGETETMVGALAGRCRAAVPRQNWRMASRTGDPHVVGVGVDRRTCPCIWRERNVARLSMWGLDCEALLPHRHDNTYEARRTCC